MNCTREADIRELCRHWNNMSKLQAFVSLVASVVGSRHGTTYVLGISCPRLRPIKYIALIFIGMLMLALGPFYPMYFRESSCAHWRKIGGDGFCSVSTILKGRSNVASLQKLRRCPLVLYNRVPKCASRTVLSVFKKLACQNGFRFVSEPKDQHEYFIRIKDLVSFAKVLTDSKEFKLYSRHVYFINFSSLNLPEPMYINVIRDPLERAASHYYYSRHGSHSAPLSSPNPNFNQTLDDCIRSGRGPCFNLAKILPFFCGHHSVCRKNNSIALKRAMRSVREHYVLVGLTEDLPAFMATISILMPQFFKNATQVFHSLSAPLWARYSTVKKIEMEPRTKEKLREILRYEYEFYKFVKQRFYHIHNKVKRFQNERYLNVHSESAANSATP